MGYYKWHFSTNFFVFIFYFLAHLAVWEIEGTKSKQIENMIEASKNQRTTTLSCHVCHSETEPGCFNFTEYGEDFDGYPQSCPLPQMVCMVKKFGFTSTDENGTTAPMRTFSVKRNCSDRCENGCVVMGERTRLYVCSQCCTTTLCNVGSGSASVHHHHHLDNSFHLFLTSVANVHFFVGTFCHLWHVLEILCLLAIQLVL